MIGAVSRTLLPSLPRSAVARTSPPAAILSANSPAGSAPGSSAGSSPAPAQVGSTLSNLARSPTAAPTDHSRVPQEAASGDTEASDAPNLPASPQVGSTAQNLVRAATKMLAGGHGQKLSHKEFQERNLQVQTLQVSQGILGNLSQMAQDLNGIQPHAAGLFDGIANLGTHVS